ncbi:MAG: NADP-dependent phosphogluconate dehydrogenase [Polyangiaceae bacterium]
MTQYAMGMVGLGVMGRNLAYNMAEHGFSVAAWDAWPEPVARFAEEGKGQPLTAAVHGEKDLGAFVASLRTPRRIVLLVKAGDVTDKTIDALVPFLSEGDILIDGGNEHFTATERRAKDLAKKGLRYFGMGVSGGEDGARHGPSMMPGGDKAAYEELRPVLETIAAKSADGPCVTYCGPGGAGHYVKMVHNGIEYGDMQLIAEAYALLKHVGGLTNGELAETFEQWNQTELSSFLIEITARIFRVKDDLGPGDLVDAVLDATGMKGTGKWTVQEASELLVPIPTIASSVEARMLAGRKALRKTFSTRLQGPQPERLSPSEKARFCDDVRGALYAAKACSYAQGFDLLGAASRARNWSLDFAEIARIWQAGCIIRAKFLTRIRAAYTQNPTLEHLLLDQDFVRELGEREGSFRRVLAKALLAGIPAFTLSASLAYYDSLRTEHLPANLTQAQRDLFGAHTYKRLDRDGDFHSPWSPS